MFIYMHYITDFLHTVMYNLFNIMFETIHIPAGMKKEKEIWGHTALHSL